MLSLRVLAYGHKDDDGTLTDRKSALRQPRRRDLESIQIPAYYIFFVPDVWECEGVLAHEAGKNPVLDVVITWESVILQVIGGRR